MPVIRHRYIFIALILLLLSCQTVTNALYIYDKPVKAGMVPTSSGKEAGTIKSPSVTLTDVLPVTPPATLLPSPTNIQSSPTLVTTATITPTPLAVKIQLDIFEELWQIVNDEYLYRDFNGLDWDAIHQEYRTKIENGLNNQDFYLAMDEMIARLGDNHSIYLDPEQVADEEAEYHGNLNYFGIGVLLAAIPERNKAVILSVFPGSPADLADLEPRDSILSVNDIPILDEHGFIRDIIRGSEGTTINVKVKPPGEEAYDISIIRELISGPLSIHSYLLTSPMGNRIGYIALVGFTDSTTDEQFADILRSLSKSSPLDGLIIDNRENTGGADTVMVPILEYFTSGIMGHYVNRQDERPLNISKVNDINNSSQIPLVILIGPDTVSYGEIFSGILQDAGRAILIGEQTEGNVEILWGYDFDDGSRAWIAHDTFRPANHPDQDWEVTGIIPDINIIVDWVEYSVDDDPAVIEALEYFDQSIP